MKTTFNDGVLVKLTHSKGVITASDGPLIAFGYKTVGIKRYHAAGERGIIAAEAVAVPLADEVAEATLVELRDYRTGQSKILRVFNPQRQDGPPAHWLLTLQETGVAYVDQRPADQCLASL